MNARRTINQTTPQGGQVPAQRNNLAAAQASTVSNLFRDKINEALERLTQIGQFGTNAGLNANQGVEGVAQQLGQLSAARLQAAMSGLGGIAGAIGTFYGGKR